MSTALYYVCFSWLATAWSQYTEQQGVRTAICFQHRGNLLKLHLTHVEGQGVERPRGTENQQVLRFNFMKPL